MRTDTIVETLRFDSETGMPQDDPVGRKVYANLQDEDARIDQSARFLITLRCYSEPFNQLSG